MRSGWLAMNGSTSSRSNASSTPCTGSNGHPLPQAARQSSAVTIDWDHDLEPVKEIRHMAEDNFTRAGVVWHVMEHDLHHGGELSLTLGMHGLPADFPG